MEADELARELEHSANCLGGDTMKVLVEKMVNTHRTINQSFMGKFVMNFIREMSNNYKNGHYDGRNETACMLANAMWEGMKEKVSWMNVDGIDEKETCLTLI